MVQSVFQNPYVQITLQELDVNQMELTGCVSGILSYRSVLL